VLGLTLAAWGWQLGPPLARADHIDVELKRQSRPILRDLRKQGYKNVGVLKFQVQMPGRQPSYNVGLLNTNMVGRLENILILYNNDTPAIGVTREAGRVAARKRGSRLSTAAGRSALFKDTYPLAWGSKRVSVDAFLTGVIKPSRDMKTTTVTIQAFDRKEPAKLRQVVSFTVPMDRSILTDLGQSFVVAQRSLTGGLAAQEAEAIRSARARDDKNDPPGQDLVELKILYNGQPVEIRQDPNSPGEQQVDEPKEGTTVSFTLRNKSDKRIGVALRVNGQNTTVEDEKELQVEQYTRWILEPGKEYPIQGFYNADGNGYKEFKVLSDEDSKQVQVSAEVKGLIQVDVFVEGGTTDPGDPNPSDPRGFTLRSGTRGLAVADKGKVKIRPRPGPVKTLADAKERVRRNLDSRPSGRGLIVAGKGGQANVAAVQFRNPTQAQSFSIRYYAKE
jgi:hypothetical protein